MTKQKAEAAADLGKVKCNLRGSVVAGSYQTCAITHTAGFAGIDDTGSIKLVVRYATDSGRPQFENPQAANYTTAVASNGAHLQLRYDLKDNIRPWGKTIHVKVLQGYLRKGDTITLTLGDRTGGSPGWRMQTFLEPTFEMRVLVDRYATYVYEQVPGSPVFSIVAGDPVKLVAVASTLAEPGEKLTVRYKREDIWGNPVGKPMKKVVPGFLKPGVYTVPIDDAKTGLKTETNPIVVRTNEKFGRYWADLHGQSEETVGSNSIEEYFAFARDFGFLDMCAHQGNDFQITDAFWKQIQQTTKTFNEPGKFVTFPGWEWSGNTGLGGDRNVLFKREGGIISRSSRALVSKEEAKDDCSNTAEELFDTLEDCGKDVMVFAHVGGRYAELKYHREGLETAVEVHSAWGTFEWMLDDAFSKGYRVAIVGNSDGHKGRPGASYPGASTFGSYGGLTCALAKSLDRKSIWDAYQQRRVYATTGARIHLDVTANGNVEMGSILPVSKEELPTLKISINGTANIERVEIRNAMQVLKTVRPYSAKDLGNRVKVLWEGAEVRGRGRHVCWDGGLKIAGNEIKSFQTINFLNAEKQCLQTSKSKLEWQSLTTGGVSGVILELAKETAGTIDVQTVQKNFKTKISGLGIKGRSYDCSGLAKRISAYRLPAAGNRRSIECEFTPAWSDLTKGDNPLYVCLVQEDGHTAWSSPIYCVKK